MAWLAGAVWLGLTPGGGVAVQAATQAASGVAERGVRVSGMIVDGHNLRPLAGAMIVLIETATGRGAASGETDKGGAFALRPVPPGTYALNVQRIGYRSSSSTLDLVADVNPDVTLSLLPHGLSLRPLVVTVARRAARPSEFERRRAVGNGTYVTRADIESQHPLLVTDLFRTVPGIRIDPGRFGNIVTLRGSCRPSMYFDGIAVDAGLSLDLSLRPDDVEGIEVYSNATTPAEYGRNACGVILVWTRQPVQVQGHTAWWKPLLVAGGVVGLRILLF